MTDPTFYKSTFGNILIITFLLLFQQAICRRFGYVLWVTPLCGGVALLFVHAVAMAGWFMLRFSRVVRSGSFFSSPGDKYLPKQQIK